MHELSIVMNIIRIADDEVLRHEACVVNAIEIEIGDLSGIEFDAFDFAWSAAVNKTVLQSAERKIYHRQGMSQCKNCNHKFRVLQRYEPCPVCGNALNEIISGEELKVKRMILSKSK